MPQQAFTDMDRKLVSEHVFIPFGHGRLEGWLSYDEQEIRSDGVLLLSPHPHLAGTMDNNVIREVATFLTGEGFVVLRFNYPGVGASSIEIPQGVSVPDYWKAVEEEQRFEEAGRPTMAVLTFLNHTLGPFLDRIHLVGYSYGAMVALKVAEKLSSIDSVTAISLPWISSYQYGFLKQTLCRKFFITAKRDFTFDPSVYQDAWPRVAEPKKIKSFDCDHFFRKREIELGEEVACFLRETPSIIP